MKAIFIFLNNSQPNIQDLAYIDSNGNPAGGFTLLASPDPERTYWIDASPEQIAAMKRDTINYEWLEDISDNQ